MKPTLTDIIQLLEKSINEENWEIASEVLSLLYVHNENNDGMFDNLEINLIESSGGAYEIFVNDDLQVFSKLNLGRFPNSTYEINKTILDSIQEGRLR